MIFSSNISYWGNAVLKHDSINNKSHLYFVKRKLQRSNIDEKSIGRIISEYKLIFCNHFVETSHFINFINNNRLAENQRADFFYYLFIYIKQYYPDFEFLKNINDVASLMTLFNTCYESVNDLLSQFLDSNSLECVNKNKELINRIFKFYGIIEDFMIRFYGYSIVGVSNQKHIITACSNCDKKFIDYLMQGYSLFRLQKIGLTNNHDNFATPLYEFFPVLPTKDTGFPIDEYIEIGNDNKIESKRLVKLL